MDEYDPRRDFDRLTLLVVRKLQEELRLAVMKLMSSDGDMALAQVERLREGAHYRLKNLDFEIDTWTGAMSEEEAVKVVRVTLASVEDALDEVCSFIAEREKAIYGEEGDDDLSE